MAISVSATDHIHVVGDSITAGFGVGPWYLAGPVGYGSLKDLLDTRIAQLPGTASGGTVSAGRAIVTGTSSLGTGQQSRLIVTGDGIFGTTMVALNDDTAVANRVTAYSPSIVLVELGINDVLTGVTDGNFQTAAQGVVSKILAQNPGVRIGFLSVLVDGEQWTSGGGGPWGPNARDANIAGKNSILAGLANATYIDTRTPMGSYEQAHNTPEPGVASGFITIDGEHPNAMGVFQMCNWVAASLGVA